MAISKPPPPRYAILGAGSWGTALAVHLAGAGGAVRLWVRDPDLARQIETSSASPRYLPGIEIPAAVRVARSLPEALAGANRVLVAIPSQQVREVLREASGLFEPDAVLVLAAKGIEKGSLALMTGIAREEAGERPSAVLSGPSFAIEVARGDPTAVVIASAQPALADGLRQEISAGALRLYSNSDPVGVQLAGAVKNVFAIASGVATGLGFGSNTVAALITRALAEMRRLGVASGGRAETFDGLAGLGDLVLSCTGRLSRNRRFGEQIGSGRTPAESLESVNQTVEGVATSVSAFDLARSRGVSMPIVEQVHAVLHEGRPPRQAIAELLSRPLRGEGGA